MAGNATASRHLGKTFLLLLFLYFNTRHGRNAFSYSDDYTDAADDDHAGKNVQEAQAYRAMQQEEQVYRYIEIAQQPLDEVMVDDWRVDEEEDLDLLNDPAGFDDVVVSDITAPPSAANSATIIKDIDTLKPYQQALIWHQTHNLTQIQKERSKRSFNNSQVAKADGFPNFLIHIPKAGGGYALPTLTRLLFSHENFQNLTKAEKFRPCNAGVTKFKDFSPHFKGIPCALYMSEQPYSDFYLNNYVVVRDPRQHILSQFFHCLESPNHAAVQNKMTSNMTEWLEEWVDALAHPERIDELMDRYMCYNPINSQTRLLGFRAEKEGPAELQQRLSVVGDMAHMDRSLCIIFIRFTGWIPKDCDCSATTVADDNRKSITAAGSSSNSTGSSPPAGFAHGVKHHGSSHPTSTYQDQLIERLRSTDAVLYQHAQTIHLTQVKEVEDEYDIRLCTKLPKPGRRKR